jgi:hypothetical protein
MWDDVRIENIEAMRLREGIDDVELREDIGALAVGDLVRLTLLPRDRSLAGETLVVRITDIHGSSFWGKLIRRPTSKGLADLRIGAPLAFTADHIHSLPKGRPAHGH